MNELTKAEQKKLSRIIDYLKAFRSMTLLEELVRREIISEQVKETIVKEARINKLRK